MNNIFYFLFLSGNDHYVEVSSNSEMVRGMALWIFFGAHRELMLRSQNLHIRLVSSRGYKAYPAVHSGDAFSCMIPRSAYNGLPEM